MFIQDILIIKRVLNIIGIFGISKIKYRARRDRTMISSSTRFTLEIIRTAYKLFTVITFLVPNLALSQENQNDLVIRNVVEANRLLQSADSSWEDVCHAVVLLEQARENGYVNSSQMLEEIYGGSYLEFSAIEGYWSSLGILGSRFEALAASDDIDISTKRFYRLKAFSFYRAAADRGDPSANVRLSLFRDLIRSVDPVHIRPVLCPVRKK